MMVCVVVIVRVAMRVVVRLRPGMCMPAISTAESVIVSHGFPLGRASSKIN